jgi:hypothetical protein
LSSVRRVEQQGQNKQGSSLGFGGGGVVGVERSVFILFYSNAAGGGCATLLTDEILSLAAGNGIALVRPEEELGAFWAPGIEHGRCASANRIEAVDIE